MTPRVPVRIITLPFLLPFWAAAQVILPRVIFVRRGVNLTLRLLAHELVHVIQWEKHGLGFARMYLASIRKSGYYDSSFEVEARKYETHPFYVQWAEELLAKRA